MGLESQKSHPKYGPEFSGIGGYDIGGGGRVFHLSLFLRYHLAELTWGATWQKNKLCEKIFDFRRREPYYFGRRKTPISQNMKFSTSSEFNDIIFIFSGIKC